MKVKKGRKERSENEMKYVGFQLFIRKRKTREEKNDMRKDLKRQDKEMKDKIKLSHSE